jgi:hypothetical protein
MSEFNISAVEWHLMKAYALLEKAKKLSLTDRSVTRIYKELLEIIENLELYRERSMPYDEPEVGNRLRKIERALELIEKKRNSFS